MPEYHFVDEILKPYLRESQSFKKVRTQKTDFAVSLVLKRLFRGYWITHNPDDLKQHKKVINGRAVLAYRERRKQEGAKPVSIMRELTVASQACKWAVAEGCLEIPNPFALRLISRADRKSIKPRSRVLSREEEARLLLASPPELQEMIQFLLATGLRRSEMLELTWDRVDLENGIITFTPELHKSGTDAQIALTKEAISVLQRRIGKGAKVFTRPLIWLTRQFTKARKIAGCADVRIHDLRRTYGTRTREKYGLEIAQIQLRHQDRRTTEQVYARPSVELARIAFGNPSQKSEFSPVS